MEELGLLEVGGNPKGAGIHQRQQLLPGRNVGSNRCVDVGQISIHRSEILCIAEVEPGVVEARLGSSHVCLRADVRILSVLQIPNVDDLGFVELGLAVEILLGLYGFGLGLLELGDAIIDISLIRRWIDLEEQIAFLDLLVVVDGNLDDRPGDPAGNADNVGADLRIPGPGAV